MTTEEFEKFTTDLIFDELESESDGFGSVFRYNQVEKAIQLAYNKGIESNELVDSIKEMLDELNKAEHKNNFQKLLPLIMRIQDQLKKI